MKRVIKGIPLYLFMIILLLLAFAISYFSYFQIVLKSVDKKIIEEAFNDNEQVAISATSYFDSKLDEQISTLIGIEVAHHNIQPNNDVFNDEYYETILDQNEYISSIEIISLTGDILYSSKEGDNRVGINIIDYPIIAESDGIHVLSLGNMVFDTDTERLTLEVLYSGEDVFVLSTISTSYFDAFATEVNEAFFDKDIMILNDKGIMLFDSNKDNHLIQAKFQNFSKVQNRTSAVQTFSLEIYDEESIVSAVPFNSNEWTLLLYESESSALALSSATTYYSIRLLYVLFLIFVLVYLIINFIVIREIKLLGVNLKKVGSGRFAKIRNTANFKEIQEVRTQFNEMSTDLEQLTNKLTYIAYHDQLTDLPTKGKAEQDFHDWKEKHDTLSFLYFDIERFSMINDNYGFDVGDYCLKEVSKILLKSIGHTYRIEGDEFLCLIKDDGISEIKDKIDMLYKRLEQGVVINDYHYSIPVSIGLSVYPTNGDNFLELLKKSMISMNENKEVKDETLSIFKDDFMNYYLRNSKIELLARNAINNDEFYTVFQPIINIKDESIRGFEALTRWNNPDLGMVSPADFIPIMERIGLINQIDEMVLNNAIRMNKYLSELYKTKFIMSVNVSVVTIMSDNFVSMIDEALERFNYDPNLLEIEITESTIISDFDKVTKKMKYLKQKGIKFSEDDFGDGFSSLTYLTRLRLDTLKISKNFLSSILSNVESRLLVQTILELSKRLGFFTIVEGVEDQKILEVFKLYGCDFVQGYLFYKPMGEEDLLTLVKERME